MRSLSSVELAKPQANTPTTGTLKERDGTTKSINLRRVHSWQCAETKSINDVTEANDAITIHVESTPEEHAIGEVLLSQSNEKE